VKVFLHSEVECEGFAANNVPAKKHQAGRSALKLLMFCRIRSCGMLANDAGCKSNAHAPDVARPNGTLRL
jgi:hypothetical protein